jgi:hypothetical protein
VLDLCRLQQRAKSVSANRIANSAFAALLAALLFFSGLLSVNHSAHRLLHPDGNNSHFCFVCSIAKGQLNAAQVGPVFICFVAALLFCTPLVRFSAMAAEDRRLAPSRAPPRLFDLQ